MLDILKSQSVINPVGIFLLRAYIILRTFFFSRPSSVTFLSPPRLSAPAKPVAPLPRPRGPIHRNYVTPTPGHADRRRQSFYNENITFTSCSNVKIGSLYRTGCSRSAPNDVEPARSSLIFPTHIDDSDQNFQFGQSSTSTAASREFSRGISTIREVLIHGTDGDSDRTFVVKFANTMIFQWYLSRLLLLSACEFSFVFFFFWKWPRQPYWGLRTELPTRYVRRSFRSRGCAREFGSIYAYPKM